MPDAKFVVYFVYSLVISGVGEALLVYTERTGT